MEKTNILIFTILLIIAIPQISADPIKLADIKINHPDWEYDIDNGIYIRSFDIDGNQFEPEKVLIEVTSEDTYYSKNIYRTPNGTALGKFVVSSAPNNTIILNITVIDGGRKIIKEEVIYICPQTKNNGEEFAVFIEDYGEAIIIGGILFMLLILAIVIYSAINNE